MSKDDNKSLFTTTFALHTMVPMVFQMASSSPQLSFYRTYNTFIYNKRAKLRILRVNKLIIMALLASSVETWFWMYLLAPIVPACRL